MAPISPGLARQLNPLTGTVPVSVHVTTPSLVGVLLAAASVTVAAVGAVGAIAIAPISAGLARQLNTLTGTVPVFVHGTDINAAKQAVADSGLTLITTWNKIGVAVARGS